MIELKAGSRLQSAVCSAEVIVVRAPSEPVELECGGVPMISLGEDRPAGAKLDPDHASGSLIGKRYVHDPVGLEVLCTKAGEGSFSVGGAALPQKEPKPLPSSD